MTSFFRRRERVAPLRVRIDMPSDVEPTDIARRLHFATGGRWPTPEPETTMPEPSVGSIVHYVSYGTPAGEYKSECRAAIVTAVPPDDAVSLCVLNPEGMYFNQSCLYHGGALGTSPGSPDVLSYEGGTWHWPC